MCIDVCTDMCTGMRTIVRTDMSMGHLGHSAHRSEDPVEALYRLYLGIADGMSIARVWTRRYSK